jgi:hypothetical protein
MPKKLVPKVEFYITNICNLTCDHCNRFNNYKFKGWQRWDDLEDIYSRWAELIDIDHRVLLGGEPLLNPDFIKWCRGLKQVWKGLGATEVITNGYRLNHVPGLYDLAQAGILFLRVTLHNSNEKDFLFNEIKTFLQEPITIEEDAERWIFTDRLGVRIELVLENQFAESAIKRNSLNQLTLHQSDPAKAHEICCMAHNGTVHFIHGKIYKCGPAALFEEFDQQYPFDISDKDRILLSSYKPLTVDNFEEYQEEFFGNLNNHIAQCKFCPEEHNMRTIYPLVKGA